MGSGSAFQMQTATAGQRAHFSMTGNRICPLVNWICLVAPVLCRPVKKYLTRTIERRLWPLVPLQSDIFTVKINFLGFYRDTGHTVCYSWKGQYVYKVQGDKWRFGSLIRAWGRVSCSSVVNHLYWHSKKRWDLNSRVNISHVNISSY